MKDFIIWAMIFIIALLIISILINKVRYYFVGSFYNEIEHNGGINNIVNLNANGTFQYEYTMIPLKGEKNKGYKFGILEGSFKKKKSKLNLAPKRAVESEFFSLENMVQNKASKTGEIDVNKLSVGNFNLELEDRKVNLIIDGSKFEMRHIKSTKIPNVKTVLNPKSKKK
ncbi:hypothetical protein [Pediococcus damnosus]|uniref:hypothetical protein n=1 Tax=Pediococcus damnosus TaxID=51663 RepID=UPI00061E966B|nr:hypothetical protein [Pediococcus damnosus]KJU74940.1 hypothetical protein AH70_03825 [Pediococcus damnosus LMG 28219]PIO85828.1 hypothetical protein BSQ37_07690 [Pediococcus damnosus]PJE49883.1 hypothetical protein BSQ36_08130 [Pediococcus damnosus]GEA93402.1 hypothetical protein PDA01_12950 [Pediococcus damnosus]